MKKLILISAASIVLVGCNAGPNQTNIELVTNMMDQPIVKAQGWLPDQPDKVQMRMPPEGTRARGVYYYPYLKDPAAAEKQPNPLAGNMSPETLTLGHKTYDIYCAVCHGATGHSDGPVAAKMAVKPRNLVSDEAKAYTDGRIYHAITAGKGVMGPYMTQITDSKRRWALVNYVRTLQRK